MKLKILLKTLSKTETKKINSQEAKTLTVISKAQINYPETTNQVSVVFDNGWIVIKMVRSLDEETIDSPMYAEKNHICKVGFNRYGELFIIENETMRSMISNK